MGGKSRQPRWTVETVPVEVFNRRLKKLRKRARRSAKGDARAASARRRWGVLEDLGARTKCCGRDFADRCSRCPREAGELVLAPW